MMHTQSEHDERVRVSGIATYDEVIADRLDVFGVLTVDGDVRVERAKLSGATTVQGDFNAASATVSGATDVDGDVTASDITVSGSLSTTGTTAADSFECSGSVQLERVEADGFGASGAVEARTMQAGAVEIRGAIEVGRVEADEVEFDLVSDSVVSHIVGDSVVVTRHRPDGFLRAEYVEGDNVALDHVDVGTAVGDRVRLGSDARVEVVRANELDAADGASVGTFERRE
jgi:cytoskeletal protein CcmA (bactofilin family)